jgi:hypothetical protein
MADRAFAPGQGAARDLYLSLRDYAPGVISDYAPKIGKAVKRGLDVLGGDTVPDIGDEFPGTPTTESRPKDIALPQIGRTPPTQKTTGPETGVKVTPSPEGPAAGDSSTGNNDAAIAGLAARGAGQDAQRRSDYASTYFDSGPEAVLSRATPGRDLESTYGARNYLASLHAGDKAATAELMPDQFDQLQGAELKALQIGKQFEDVAPVPGQGPYKSTIRMTKGGTFTNDQLPRMSGAEYKASLERERIGATEAERAGAAERAKGEVESARRTALFQGLQEPIEREYSAQEQILRQTKTGDQLELALQGLRKAKARAMQGAFERTFLIGERIDPRQ